MAPVLEEDMHPGASLTKEGKVAQKEFWPLWKLCLIALPQLSIQVLWCFIGPNSAPYMYHLGMPPFLATLNNMAGPITGFFTGPLVGAISDSCTSSLGRRRPVILAGLTSTWIAGMLFASSEHIFPAKSAVYFAAPMFWVVDVTVNILQTPHRALVADLASEEQQVPCQVVFVFVAAIGNFVGYSLMKVYDVTVDHMLELMLFVCLLNTFCVGIQFLVAKETPLRSGGSGVSLVQPVKDVCRAACDSPRLLYHLSAVQCLVWVGLTAWNGYGMMWFGNSVFGGDENAKEGSPEKKAFAKGEEAFALAGQFKAVLQLISSLIIIAIMFKTETPPRLVYAPCIFVGAVTCAMAAFVVGHCGWLAVTVMACSVLPEVGSFAIPFGLVAMLNKHAEKEGKKVSTGVQMAFLNCCITVGQQACTMTLAVIQIFVVLSKSMPLIFMVAAGAKTTGGILALFLNDTISEDDEGSSSGGEEEGMNDEEAHEDE